jgi:uncharacterized protein
MKRREFLTAPVCLAGAVVLPRCLEAMTYDPILLAHLGAHEGRFNSGGLTIVAAYSAEGHYMAGQAVAQLISRHVSGAKAMLTVVATTADALRLLRAGRTETPYGHFVVNLAVVDGDEADARIREVTGGRPEEPADLRLLTLLPPELLHIVTLRESPVRRVGDLKGKTVSIGPAGSRSAKVMGRLLEALDLSGATALQREALPLAAALKALAERRIDAFAWHGPVSPALFAHLGGLLGIQMTLVSQTDGIVKLRLDGGPAYYAAVIPKGAYQWLETDVRVVGTQNLLIGRADLSAQLAYDIVRTVNAHPEAFDGAGGSLPELSGGPEPSLPLHPGAKKFREEIKPRLLTK